MFVLYMTYCIVWYIVTSEPDTSIREKSKGSQK